jgi:hypothetical protein
MNNDKEEAWLLTDDYENEIIVGNKLGLIKLKDAIDKTLESNEENINDYVQDTNVSKIILKDKDDYLSSFSEHKETLFEKALGVLIFTWFLILPFVGVFMIIYCLFFLDDTVKVVYKTPLQNLIDRQP